MKTFLEIHPEVQEAFAQGRPVVALESTIISHGMPYPQNLETSYGLDKIIRNAGAVPATIAILNGKLKVGLTQEELEFFAVSKDIIKASRRDLPTMTARKLNGATTVAATMIIAAAAGIPVFVTGGIGGVHRGGAETFDISADLQELAKTNVAVVCAGAKSILDIGLTLEYLETQGVPVLSYQSEDFPAFYTRTSGFKADCSVSNPQEAAQILHDKWAMGLEGGVVIGNPIPAQYAMEEQEITKAIDQALLLAEEKGIRGKETTPFLLDQLKKVTEGRSLEANIQLVYHNARVGSAIAVELAKLAK